MTFKSHRRHRRTPRDRWAHVNTQAGLMRRRATQDARREALAATLPPMDCGPPPGAHWVTVRIDGAAGPLLVADLYVPTGGRCDQHAAVVDGHVAPRMLTATALGQLVAQRIPKRPSTAQLEQSRRW